MKSNNQLIRKENLISIVVTLLFVLGFFMLINNNTITTYTILDNSTIQSGNFTFGIEAPTPVINNSFPKNNTNYSSLQIGFTYNISVTNDLIENCSLYLDIDDAGFSNNVTLHTDYNSDLTNPINKSDGFSTSALGAGSPIGITTNGTDFWITDNADYFVYHTNASGDNQTDGFSTSALGAGSPYGITTNGTDFWIVDSGAIGGDKYIYHINASGDNQTDGFSTSALGASTPFGITTNGTDFWITDYTDDYTYHVNASGDNQTDGFSTSALGSEAPYSITTNGTDFWIVDNSDKYIYHTNKSGYNYSDGFSAALTSDGASIYGITTPSFNMSLVDPGGTPTEFWIIDLNDQWAYHLKAPVKQIINQSITMNFDDEAAIKWKVGCYSNSSVQANSSIKTLTIDTTPPIINLQFPVNDTNSTNKYVNFTYNTTDTILGVDSCVLWLYQNGAWGLNDTDTSITEEINQSFNKSFIRTNQDNLKWKVECNDTVNNRGNSSINALTINKDQIITLISPTNNTRTSDSSISFTYNVTDPDNDIDNCTLYHNINNTGYTNVSIDNETINETITNYLSATIDNTVSYLVYWKIGCYTDDSYQANSSESLLITTFSETMVLRGGAGGGTRYKNKTQYENVSRPVYIFLPAPTADENAQYVIQKIDMAKMNMDPNFQKLLGSAIFQIDLEDVPMEKVVGTIGETMYISIGGQTKIDVDYSGERTRIAIRDILREDLQKPIIPSLFWMDIKIYSLLILLIFSVFFSASKIVPNAPQIKDFIKNRIFKYILTGVLFRFTKISKKLPKQKGPIIIDTAKDKTLQPKDIYSSIIEKEKPVKLGVLPNQYKFSRRYKKLLKKKVPVIIKKLREETVETNKIFDEKTTLFNKLYNLTREEVENNKLNLANKHYKELLKIYNYLLLISNKKEQYHLYILIKEIYDELTNRIDIRYCKEKLK